jgi:hypothetical protein
VLFTIGDYLAGALIGVATALAVRFIVAPGMDMVVSMLLGMAVGMLLHLLLGFLLRRDSVCSRPCCGAR